MVDNAVAKAREIGVSENVAILDDGGSLKAFSRMDGASIPTIEIAQNKAYTGAFQERVGYTGDYDSWIASVTLSITADQVDFPTDIALEATRQSSAAFYCAACR